MNPSTMDKILNLFASLVPDADEEMQKRLVQIWSENKEIHDYLLFDDIPGEKSPEIPSESPKKEKKESEKKEKKFDPVIFLKENPETIIEFIQENPKKSGSDSHEIYEKYKTATTFQEILDSGGKNGHIRHDFSKGFLKILDDSVDNIEYEPKKKKTPVKKKPNKVKKEVKKEQKNKVKKEEIVIQANDDDEEEDVVPFKPFGNINSDSSSDEECQDDDEMPIKTVDGVDYYHNESDKMLIDKTTAVQIGYLDEDGTIDYIDNGEEIHKKNKIK